MNLETSLRDRPRNRWQDEVMEEGRLGGGKGQTERVYDRGMEEASENHKESLHTEHANGMNVSRYTSDIRMKIACQLIMLGK
jgi:hypothetical protein